MLMLFAVLRRADEHLDQIVVQAVKNLPLERPLELRVLEIARMQLEVVGVYRRVTEPRANDDFHRFALGARVELDERMLVEAKLMLHAD